MCVCLSLSQVRRIILLMSGEFFDDKIVDALFNLKKIKMNTMSSALHSSQPRQLNVVLSKMLCDDHRVHKRRRTMAIASSSKYEPPIIDDNVDRRNVVLSLATVFVAAVAASPSPAGAQTVVHVGPDAITTISRALEIAQPGDTIIISSGKYAERLLIDKAVTLAAAPGATVEISWQTEEHYESTIVCTAEEGVTLERIIIRHASPSVANNYAVQLINSGARVDGCDISSATGSGVGVEGGAQPHIINCTIHDCARSGIMIFADLEGNSVGTAVVRDCIVMNNALHGVLVRDGAAPVVGGGNIIQGNGGYGLALQGCGGVYKGNVVKGNRKGEVAVNLLLDGLSREEIAKENELQLDKIRETTLR